MSEDVTALAPEMDVLAGEYVLGTLDPGERAAAQSLIAQDAAFAAKVKVWERRLGELHLMVEPIDPEPEVWARIKARLPEPAPLPPPADAPEPEPALTLPEFKLELEPEPAPMEPRSVEPELPFAFKPTLAPEPAVQPEPPMAPETPAKPPDVIALPSFELPPAEPGPASPPAAQVSEKLPELPSFIAPKPKPPAAAAASVETEQVVRALRRQLAGWRVLAAVMGFVLIAMAGLIAMWRYAPERVPPPLRPAALMRLAGINIGAAPTRRPLPRGSQFDE